MARFTLLIDGRGAAVLTTPDVLTPGQVSALQALFKDWQGAEPPEALIAMGCDVVRVDRLELDVASDPKVQR